MVEGEPIRERERTVKNAWLFDVDGVLSHLEEKKMTEEELLDKLIQRLEAGEPLIFNTGRSVGFVIDGVFKPLENKITDKKLLENILIIGEKGAISLLYGNGEFKEYIDQNVEIPEDFK